MKWLTQQLGDHIVSTVKAKGIVDPADLDARRKIQSYLSVLVVFKTSVPLLNLLVKQITVKF